ncbi:MAG: aquaporin family protein [Planctomycetota bacterium]|nr:MAG: aquaporin family protein [Planctomycetota bacterium]
MIGSLQRRAALEGIGTAILVAVVVGSGIMAQRLAGGNDALALLGNTLATVAALGVLIQLLGPVSGAHFNPLVSIVQSLRGALGRADCGAYVAAQLVGACAGTWLAHAMFDLPLLQTSTHARAGLGQALSEVVATAGLLFVIVGGTRANARGLAWLVAAWVGAGYWFTASTCFANPAVALARSLTDTFSGIRPSDVPAFVLGQSAGAALGALAACLIPQARSAEQ